MNSSPMVIIGFGSQAKAWAMNLKDSNIPLVIALNPESPTHQKAKDLGFKTVCLQTEQLQNFNNFILLIPDDLHATFFEKNVQYIKPNSRIIYAHGFSMAKERLHEKYPQYHHALLAPKAIASEVRFQYEIKGKIGAIYYSTTKEDLTFIQELSKQVGFTAIYQAHFEEECIADLFSEQTLLCSLIPYGALKTFNILLQNGIPRELAFMECFLEVKSIAQAFVNLGPEGFFKLISPNALIGSEKGQELLFNAHLDDKFFLTSKIKHFIKK